MKKLTEKLKKIEYELPKWTRELLYEHLIAVCEDIEEKKTAQSKLRTIFLV